MRHIGQAFSSVEGKKDKDGNMTTQMYQQVAIFYTLGSELVLNSCCHVCRFSAQSCLWRLNVTICDMTELTKDDQTMIVERENEMQSLIAIFLFCCYFNGMQEQSYQNRY